jgi:hypothetical protein
LPSRAGPYGSLVTPSIPTAASARWRRSARSRAGLSLRCASAWNRPAGSRCARSTPCTSPADLVSNVTARARMPSCSSPPHGPPGLGRLQLPRGSPTSTLLCRPPTPCPHPPWLRFPLPGASLDAGACSLPGGRRHVPLQPRRASETITSSPRGRNGSRRGEGLPGAWAVLFVRAMVAHPAGYVPLLAPLSERPS